MSAQVYEVLALAMRYWFVFLGVLIVLRTFLWLMRDRRNRHRRLQGLPDAGMIGELVIVDGGGELEEGASIPLPYEGTLGFVRSCDVVIPCKGVGSQHLDFSFQPQVGILVYPRRGRYCTVDESEMSSHSKARENPLHHGSILQVGKVKLRVRLFEGVECGGRHAHYQTDPDEIGELQPVVEPRSQAVPAQVYPWVYQPEKNNDLIENETETQSQQENQPETLAASRPRMRVMRGEDSDRDEEE